MIKKIKLSDEFHYVLERYRYESNRHISNLSFMLSKNINNPDFLNSEQYQAMLQKATDSILEKQAYDYGVVLSNLTPSIQIKQFMIDRENRHVLCEIFEK